MKRVLFALSVLLVFPACLHRNTRYSADDALREIGKDKVVLDTDWTPTRAPRPDEVSVGYGSVKGLQKGDIVDIVVHESGRKNQRITIQVTRGGSTFEAVLAECPEGIAACCGANGTPHGRWPTGESYSCGKHSTLNRAWWMPHFIRIGSTSRGLHGGGNDGQPGEEGPPVLSIAASHGCVRNNHPRFLREFNDAAKSMGAQVFVKVI